MTSNTLEMLLSNEIRRQSVLAVQDRMGISENVMRYAFWHLDTKHAGKLPGVIRESASLDQIEDEMTWNDTEEYVEMVIELVQMDLLVGQANRLSSIEHPNPSRHVVFAKGVAAKSRSRASGVESAGHVARRAVAAKWKIVTTRRSSLAEDSSAWSDHRITAKQKSILVAVDAWQNAVARSKII